MQEVETSASPEYQAKYYKLKELLHEEPRRGFNLEGDTLTIELSEESEPPHKGEIIKLTHRIILQDKGHLVSLTYLFTLSPNGIISYSEGVMSYSLLVSHVRNWSFLKEREDEFLDEEDRAFERNENRELKLRLEAQAFAVVERFTTETPKETQTSEE